ncbi:hypothetical protein ABIB27_002969 [Arthrobacter sp. UYEF21]
MSGLSVRRAVGADVERLAEVHLRCWQATYGGMLSDAFLAAVDPAGRLGLGRRLLEAALGTKAASLWVAADTGKATGFYTGSALRPTVPRTTSLAGKTSAKSGWSAPCSPAAEADRGRGQGWGGRLSASIGQVDGQLLAARGRTHGRFALHGRFCVSLVG